MDIQTSVLKLSMINVSKFCGLKLTSTQFKVGPTIMVCGDNEYENVPL